MLSIVHCNKFRKLKKIQSIQVAVGKTPLTIIYLLKSKKLINLHKTTKIQFYLENCYKITKDKTSIITLITIAKVIKIQRINLTQYYFSY